VTLSVQKTVQAWAELWERETVVLTVTRIEKVAHWVPLTGSVDYSDWHWAGLSDVTFWTFSKE